jgi:GNAT superfamily N-acetyltransferase
MIRAAELDDAFAIARLCQRVFSETYAQWAPAAQVRAWVADYYSEATIAARCCDSNYLLLVAEEDERIVGAAHAHLLRQRGQGDAMRDDEAPREANDYKADGSLGGLCVHPPARGQGFGSDLLEQRLTWLSENGARLVHCGVAEQNRGVLRVSMAEDSKSLIA